MPDRRFLAAALLLAVAVGSGSGTALAEGAPADAEAGKSTPLDLYDPLYEEEIGGELLERDPFERANRLTFAFNLGVDYWVLDPVTRGYQWLVPGPLRRGVNRIFANLNSPVIFANEVLQLRPQPAANTLIRFIVNSTFGLGGMFDVAELLDVPAGEADFGQTLARYWGPRGPYIVLPVLGPSTARDVVGTAVDLALDPLTYIVGPLNLQWHALRGGSYGLVLRDANFEELQALRDSSVDFYSALRSAYLQNRLAKELEVRGEYTPEAPVGDAAPADQDSLPEASFSMRSSIAAISPSKSSRFTMLENSDRRSASSLTVPSR